MEIRKPKIKWGIIGPGNIASHFASDLAMVPDADLVAVASRSITRTSDFANQFNIRKVYDSYGTMLDEAGLDRDWVIG